MKKIIIALSASVMLSGCFNSSESSVSVQESMTSYFYKSGLDMVKQYKEDRKVTSTVLKNKNHFLSMMCMIPLMKENGEEISVSPDDFTKGILTGMEEYFIQNNSTKEDFWLYEDLLGSAYKIPEDKHTTTKTSFGSGFTALAV